MLFAVASAELEADPLLFFVIVEAASSASLLSLLLLLLLLPLLELPASKEGKRLYVLPEHHCEILFSALNPPFASCSFPLPLVINRLPPVPPRALPFPLSLLHPPPRPPHHYARILLWGRRRSACWWNHRQSASTSRRCKSGEPDLEEEQPEDRRGRGGAPGEMREGGKG